MSKRKRKPAKPSDPKRTPNDFAVDLLQLEIASGYDGLWRGAPEPVVAIAAYACPPLTTTNGMTRGPRTLFRGLFRIDIDGARFPQTVDVTEDDLTVRGEAWPVDEEIVVVAAAVEDDGGLSVQRVFGALERGSEVLIAPLEGAGDPMNIRELCAQPDAWRESQRALVLVDDVPLAQRCVGDDWIGSTALCVRRERGQRRHRLHFLSDDKLNDWTAIIATRVGWRA